MREFNQNLDALAERASQGDCLAKEMLQQAIEHSLGPIARRALRQDENAVSLSRYVRRILLDSLGDKDRRGLADTIARSIYEALCRSRRGSAPRHANRETVRG